MPMIPPDSLVILLSFFSNRDLFYIESDRIGCRYAVDKNLRDRQFVDLNWSFSRFRRCRLRLCCRRFHHHRLLPVPKCRIV